MVKIVVFMSNKAVNVWRPIDAELISGGLYEKVKALRSRIPGP